MYNITCNTDDKYVQHCCAMLCSLFENNKEEQITIHILCNSLSNANQLFLCELANKYEQKICFHFVDETKLNGVQFRNKRPLTKAAYYRLLLSSILNDLDKVLYLDCDMIVLGKIKDLFNLDISNYALAAVADGMPFNECHQLQLNLPANSSCFCSGIMLVNLEYWRNNDIEKKLLDFAKRKRNPVFLHDQDVLNYVLHNDWFMLSPKWNYNPGGVMSLYSFKAYHYADAVFSPAIIHYCSNIFKPWYKAPCPGRKYYRHYLKLSKYSNPQFTHLPIKKQLHCYYFYWKKNLCNLKPILPKIIVIIFSDLFNMLRLISYLFLFIGKKKVFNEKIKRFYGGERIKL